MSTSSYFRVHDKILLEYVYNRQSYSSATFGFRQILNAYDNSLLNLNKKSADNTTNNIERFSAVELDNGKVALLGEDTAFYYPNVDGNIEPADLTFSSTYNVQYDAVRFHFISGYNFDDIEGFFCEFYLRSQNNRVIKLSALTYIKQYFNLLKFNSRPFSLEDLVFDKYVEILIPSTDWLLNQQQFSLTNDNPVYQFTGGDLLSEVPTIYCNFSTLFNLVEANGLVSGSVQENRKFAISSVDLFSGFAPYIAEDTANGLFKYQAQFDGLDVQEFMAQLNSLAGNQYYLIHELDIVIQNGAVFQTVDQLSIIQKDNYIDMKMLRPIIPPISGVTSLSIDYTLRLYNAADGKNIVKTASVSTSNVNKYAMNGTKLSVGETTEPLKIYNQIQRKDMSLVADLGRDVQTKIVYLYVDNSTIGLGSSGNLKLTPFDNLIKFDVIKTDGTGFQQLDFVSNYYLVFVDDSDKRIYIPEFIAASANKDSGEIFFKVNQEHMNKISTFKNRNFYVVAKSPNAIESSIGSGSFVLEHEVTKDIVLNAPISPGIVQESTGGQIRKATVAEIAATTGLDQNSITVTGSTIITPQSLDNINVNPSKLVRNGRSTITGKDFLMP